jgi:hypothetical protein
MSQALSLAGFQGRKTHGHNHSRPENKGLSAGNGPFRCTAFMRFRGPQALIGQVTLIGRFWVIPEVEIENRGL